MVVGGAAIDGATMVGKTGLAAGTMAVDGAMVVGGAAIDGAAMVGKTGIAAGTMAVDGAMVVGKTGATAAYAVGKTGEQIDFSTDGQVSTSCIAHRDYSHLQVSRVLQLLERREPKRPSWLEKLVPRPS